MECAGSLTPELEGAARSMPQQTHAAVPKPVKPAKGKVKPRE
ncbi:MAG: hypothetical protein RSC08_05720 [Oscillospiraceae bacterium]